jgi:hypothetical protein
LSKNRYFVKNLSTLSHCRPELDPLNTLNNSECEVIIYWWSYGTKPIVVQFKVSSSPSILLMMMVDGHLSLHQEEDEVEDEDEMIIIITKGFGNP